ncbi:MAG: DUF177 domain-containing protein [Deltaproteobacteria bacterium]
MKVRVAELREAVRTLNFEESAGAMNETVMATTGWAGQRFEKDVAVAAEIYLSGSDVHFSGSLTGTVTCTCPRCLDEFSLDLGRNFRFLLVTARDVEADQGLDRYSGSEIDLGPLVREQAVLELDGSALCLRECRGLCAGCGVNLNREECSCRKGE